MGMLLYDLAAADPARRFSPYCWRIKMALSHKGLRYDTVPWRFTDKDVIAFSGQGFVPVLVDGGKVVSDSWNIAIYLEDHYPDRPSLFHGDGGRAITRFVNTWSFAVLAGGIVRLIVTDIFRNLDEKDRDYFRKTREQRFGKSLEETVANRDMDVLSFRKSLEPVRTVLAAQDYLGGTTPAYADYIVFSCFQWARCISPFPLLLKDDPVWLWRERLLSEFDGFARRAEGYEV
jgi:glutathione S-transferase